ncbi:MAG: hypothetical protein ACXACK_06270 [Candidatus Hodarchaeales archaeon]|jgi:hypothetical protein
MRTRILGSVSQDGIDLTKSVVSISFPTSISPRSNLEMRLSKLDLSGLSSFGGQFLILNNN